MACMGMDASASTATTATVTNNGAALTWNDFIIRNFADTGGVNGSVQASWAYLDTARTGMTVTFTNNHATAQDISGKLYVLTGVDIATPIGGTAEGSSTSNTVSTSSFTSQVVNSLGFVLANDYQTLGAPTVTGATTDTYHRAGDFSGMSAYVSTGLAGSSITF